MGAVLTRLHLKKHCDVKFYWNRSATEMVNALPTEVVSKKFVNKKCISNLHIGSRLNSK